jgi:hypothetical protein
MTPAKNHVAETYPDPPLKDLKLNIKTLPRYLCLLTIKAYQRWISPAISQNACKYYPTCSHYGYQAIYKYGALRGGWLAVKRIARCNPFSKGGIDPVP